MMSARSSSHESSFDAELHGKRPFYDLLLKSEGRKDPSRVCLIHSPCHPERTVSFEPTLDFKIQRVGSWFSTFFSSEGLVCRFEGQGKLFIQSRNPQEFGSLVGSKLPPRSG